MSPPTFSAEREWLQESIPVPTQDELLLIAKEVRRERTGVHALIGIACNGTILAHDTFNIGRNEERGRLAKSAHGMLPHLLREAIPQEALKHQLDTFCLVVPATWEANEISIVQYDEHTVINQPVPLLASYIVAGGGTIAFAPPGAGKSYLALLKAQALAMGDDHIWAVPEVRPVLFVNLERSPSSLAWRDRQVRRALGIQGGSEVSYLHGRGKTISAIKRHLYQWAKRHQGLGVVFIDSLSRAAEGPLGEDQTANEVTNVLNGIDGSWYAIGHTPRADKGHLFGSVHWDAGADIQIKVSSERKENALGLRLEVVKANDLAFPQPEYLALEFDDEGLASVRTASSSEFLELAAGEKLTRLEELVAYVKEVTLTGATSASEAIGLGRSHVSELLNKPPFVFVKMEGRTRLYGLLATQTPETR